MRSWIAGFLLLLAAASTAVAAESTPSDRLKAIEAERPAFMSTWESLVNIDSGTDNSQGLAQVEALLTLRLKQLGANVEVTPAMPAAGNNIVATFKGTGSKRIMLMIHYDTVFLEGEAGRRPFRIDEKRAYGPGVADAKGGVAMILHTVKMLNDEHFDGYGTLTVLFNPDEEKSSLGSRALIRQLAARQDYVLSFEPPENENVTVATNGIAYVHLEVTGLASHAGSAPEKGRNAAIELAHQLLQLNHLGDPATGTTVNWTVVRAGEKVNVIPDAAQAMADMRLSDAKEIERVQKQAETILQKHLVPDTTVTVRVEDRRPPFTRNPASEKLAQTANRIYQEINRSVEPVAMRFGTDAGFAYDPQNDKPAVLETLGIVGARIHSAEEFAELDSIVPRLYLTVRMIQELSRER